MAWRIGVAFVLFACACQEAPVLILSDRDGGPADGGLDAGVPKCWTLDDFVGGTGALRQFGSKIALTEQHVYVSAYTSEPTSWFVIRLASRGNEWGVDATLRGLDFGRDDDNIESLVADDDGLWIGVPGAANGGAVHHASFDLELIGPALFAPGPSVEFGAHIARSGRWLFVADPARDRHGAVDVFDVEGETPTHVTTLRLDSSPRDARFGDALAARGDTLLVGEPLYCNTYTCDDRGHVHVFSAKSGAWEFERTIDPPLDRARRFGSSIAWPTEDRIWISAPATYHCVDECIGGTTGDPEPGSGGCPGDQIPCRFVGAAFEMDGEASMLRVPSELGSDQIYNLRWGETVQATASWIALAAPGDASCSFVSPVSYSCGSAGAVHIFAATDDGARPARYLKAYDLDTGPQFSTGLALRGRRLVVGAPQHCGETPDEGCLGRGTGGVYVYTGCDGSEP